MARKTYYLPDDLEERLSARATDLQRSASWCVQRAVEAWLGDLLSPKGADRGAPETSPSAVSDDGAARSSAAAPRAPAPMLQRVQRLGVPSKPIPRRTR